jgi:hypothetical protein
MSGSILYWHVVHHTPAGIGAEQKASARRKPPPDLLRDGAYFRCGVTTTDVIEKKAVAASVGTPFTISES